MRDFPRATFGGVRFWLLPILLPRPFLQIHTEAILPSWNPGLSTTTQWRALQRAAPGRYIVADDSLALSSLLDSPSQRSTGYGFQPRKGFLM